MNDDFRQHIDDLKSASSGSQIAAEFQLNGRGKRFFCPACQPNGGKSPDLDVFDKGFRCYKCGVKGDVIDLVVLVGQMTRADAIRWLENRSGMDRTHPTSGRKPIGRPAPPMAVKKPSVKTAPPTLIALYVEFLRAACQPIRGTVGASYLSNRGIDPEVADRCGVRFCSDLSAIWTLADRAVIKAAGLSSLYVFQKAGLPVLVFPYLRAGQPVFLKVRCLLSKAEADRLEIPRFLNSGGVVPCLWNHDIIKNSGRVLICEGEIDALSAIVAGHAAVGLPGWSHWKDAWIEDFDEKDVVLVMDADAAGDQGVRSIAKSFVSAGRPVPRQLILPSGLDLNDYLREDGKE